MKTRLKSLIFVTLTMISAGCSSTFKVVSDPVDAEVALLIGEANERKAVGKTPLEMPSKEFANLLTGVQPGEFFVIEITKAGFAPERFTIPATRFGTTLTQLNVKMKAEDKSKEQENQDNLKNANEIVNRLFLAQKFAVMKQFERALIELDKILEKFPEFPRALSMKGSIYLAQQNFDESLKWYDQALKSDPQMEDTVRLAARVRELIAARQPASQQR